MKKKQILNGEQFDKIDPKHNIIVKGARVNNLKNISVAIPRNKLVVMTGLSGSGKSSLAFDTLYAEGQRMYVESLSSYSRQFLGRMEKPAVDYIRGISPAIGLVQKTSSKNVHSTVGTTTEIYDYLKLLFARIGETFSPISNQRVTKDTVELVVDSIMKYDEDTKIVITTPLIIHEGRVIDQEIKLLLSKGFTRIIVDKTPFYIEELLDSEKQKKYLVEEKNITIVIDRIAIKHTDEIVSRLSDSVQTAFYEGMGECFVQIIGKETLHFSNKFEKDGILFEQPTVNFFSFNNPYGACKKCQGYGDILGIDPNLVIPNQTKTIYEDAILPWSSSSMSKHKKLLISVAEEIGISIHKPIKDFDEGENKILWYGKGKYKGIYGFFDKLEKKTYQVQYRILLSRYKGKTICPDCKGTRLRKDSQYVKINNYSIDQLVKKPIINLHDVFEKMTFNEYQRKIASRIIAEIKARISFLLSVGLGYLTLNRLSHTLSGGEYQRIKLSTSLGSSLVGAMYILDEPSIGLHPRDTCNMIKVLKELKLLGNTVVVVEHEEEIIRAADQIIDIGPNAGSQGGHLMFQGSIKEAVKSNVDSHTIQYLSGKVSIKAPKVRRQWRNSITIKGIKANNLKNINATFPLNTLTVISGVSGSGKSTLMEHVLYSLLRSHIGLSSHKITNIDSLEGDISSLDAVEFVDQKSIGKSSRSNPASYLKAYDAIRQLYARQNTARKKNLTTSSFSFNVVGGRCENCDGEGVVRIEMQFMADVVFTCTDCKGKRFNNEVLEVKYRDKNIDDVLNLTVDDALEFFSDEKLIYQKLLPLQKVGMGYIKLGQSSNTLSGGEAQRVKLATFLQNDVKQSAKKKMFIFDEPTTGLHFHDINKLRVSLNALVDNGHSVIVIEHNLEIIKSSDWIIDLGPEAGDKGGQIVFQGTPEDLCKEKNNHTAKFLKKIMDKNQR